MTKFLSIYENFLDFGKIPGLQTIFDFYKSYLWIYELSQDLKLFFRSDKLFKSDLSERYRFYMVFSDLQNNFGLSLFGFRSSNV